MPVFSYTAYDKAGRKLKGTVEAKNEVEAISNLLGNGYKVVEIREIKGQATRAVRTPSKKKRALFGISLNELAIFSRQFATMISAGIRVKRALEILSEQAVFSSRFRNIIKDVIFYIDQGDTLSEAFERTGVFEPVFLNLIKAGEEGGVLDKVLTKLADFYESSKQLQDEVKAAMRYPIFVGGFAILIVGVIAFYVIPSLVRNIGLNPTGIVAFLLNVSNFLSANALQVTVGVGSFAVFMKFFLSTIHGKRLKESFQSVIPGLRNVTVLSMVERFSRTLGILVGAGVSITDALIMAANASGKFSMIKKAESAVALIKEGKTLRDALAELKMVPQLVYEMVGTGEATGKLEEILEKVADFYEQQLRIAVKKFVSMIEPMLIAFIGGFIAFLALSLYSTVFQFQTSVGSGGF